MSNNGGDDAKGAATATADSIMVDRSCIGCDNCGVGSPQKCCARCGSFYYCSKECQVQHWKQHKSKCTIIKAKHEYWKKIMSNGLPDGTALDTKEGPCAICLEETITNPVVLPCGHAFCFACVGGYQCSPNAKEVSCPYCRGEIPDVAEKAAERAVLYGKRAMASSKGSDDQKKYAKLAIAEYESLVELLDPEEDKEKQLEILYVKAMMMSYTDQPEELIKLAKKILLLNEKYGCTLDSEEIGDLRQWQADAYLDCGKWEDAVKGYKAMIRENKQRGRYKENYGAILIGYSRALYELCKYDEAIEYGNIAIELDRSFSGVHKYVALSQKAKGDIDEAKETVSRAILYEWHLDKDNLQKNKDLLRELNNL